MAVETEVAAFSGEIIKAITITGPIGIILGFGVWKLWAALSDERAFSRDLHERTIRVIEANTTAMQGNTSAVQGNMRSVERLEGVVEELRRGIADRRP